MYARILFECSPSVSIRITIEVELPTKQLYAKKYVVGIVSSSAFPPNLITINYICITEQPQTIHTVASVRTGP